MDDIGHQALLAVFICAGENQHLAYGRMMAQYRLNLTQFDTETTELHLVIEACQKLDTAIGQEAYLVSCFIEMSIWLIAEGVSNEAFGSQFRAIEIAPGQTGAADVKLSWHTYRNRLQVGIQQVDLRVGDRTANWNGFCPFRYILHKVPGCEGGTLRRPIHMQQSLWWTVFEHLFDPLGINSFTTKEQVTNRTKGPWNFACQQIEQCRRQEHGANPLLM